MGRKSVAIVDIRSSEVTVLVGERGVNNTFIFKAIKTETHTGFEDGKFYDVDELKESILRAYISVKQTCGERIDTVYIGVPGAFCEVLPKEQSIGFPKPRKVSPKDLSEMERGGVEGMEGYAYVRAESMLYVTSDNRRVVDPVGLTLSGLTGIYSYFYCAQSFISIMEEVFDGMHVKLCYLPTELAQARYLIPSESRDEYALFLDSDFLTTTVCVVWGGGVLAQKSIWNGTGQIAAELMDRFALPYEGACALIPKINLYRKESNKREEFFFRGEGFEFDVDRVNETVRSGIGDICEELGKFLEDFAGKELDSKPLLITGNGLTEIKGALEHMTRRMSRICEEISPNLPYYNKPSASSRISLLDMACRDKERNSWIYRSFSGGKI